MGGHKKFYKMVEDTRNGGESSITKEEWEIFEREKKTFCGKLSKNLIWIKTTKSIKIEFIDFIEFINGL